MKKYSLLFALAFSITAALAAKPSESHLSGYIDDSMCAASSKPMCTPATRASCAVQCLKSGAKGRTGSRRKSL
jgi:hypothetical protein